jgi:SAM-dependent methyltransferase
MPKSSVLRTLTRELLSGQGVDRVPEPDLVMDDPEKVAAYQRAGLEDGVMAPVYLFHCAQVCQLLKPGDTVVDLGCGPATQLAMVARLNPDCNFIGIDLSDDMLSRAHEYVSDLGLSNVELRKGSMTQLDSFAGESVDAIFTTVALHHLPDIVALEQTFQEIARVLKPGGGLYLVDFGRLKSEKSMQEFANQYAEVQAELFTLDYLYSLQAAFTRQDFVRLTEQYLGAGASVKATFGMPFMVAVSQPRDGVEASLDVRRQLIALKHALSQHHMVDLKNLKLLFRLGGLPSSLL